MAFDPSLAERVTAVIGLRPDVEEKKMFGCLAWLLNGNFCLAVWKDSLVLRIDKAKRKPLFEDPFVQPFDMKRTPMKGLAMVAAEGIEDEADLKRYVKLALDYVGTFPPK